MRTESMKAPALARRGREYGLYHVPQHEADTITEIMRGLSMTQKTIDPKFFYDTRGSQLYEKITQTADYYLTRSENEILRRHAASIAKLVGVDAVVIEPGAGSCQKIEYLLDELQPNIFVPVDVSYTTLDEACERLVATYRWLDCMGIVAEFDQLEYINRLLPDGRRVAFFPGSTLGNMDPAAALAFLRRLQTLVDSDGGILIGLDNVKDVRTLNQAYNDSDGITAAFNKNILNRLNRIVGADFLADNFEHQAFFNSDAARIEMHLISKVDQRVQVGNQFIALAEGESIHTENSYKYTRDSFADLAAQAGLRCERSWHDERDYFTLYYLVVDRHLGDGSIPTALDFRKRH